MTDLVDRLLKAPAASPRRVQQAVVWGQQFRGSLSAPLQFRGSLSAPLTGVHDERRRPGVAAVTGATPGLTEAQISAAVYLDRAAALSVLGAPGNGGGAPRTPGSLVWTRRSTGTPSSRRWSARRAPTTIIGLVLVRFLQHEQKRQAQRPEEPPATAEDVYLWYVTAVVLADKFTNDDSTTTSCRRWASSEPTTR